MAGRASDELRVVLSPLLPGWRARLFSRVDLHDPCRWDLLLADLPPDEATATLPAPLPETIAVAGWMDLVTREEPVDHARAVLSDLEQAMRDEPVASEPLELVRIAVTEPVADERRLAVLTEAPLDRRLEAIRAQRPWSTNALYRSIEAGTAAPDHIAVYLDQWSEHLAFGPALFAAMLAAAPAGTATHRRLAANVLAGVRSGGEHVNRREHLRRAVRRLRVALDGPPSSSGSATVLPETRAHVALMRSISQYRTVAESAAAVLALKRDFAPTCAAIAAALERHYGVTGDGLEFFVHQAERADTGSMEEEIVMAEAGSSPERLDQLATAFRDGLASYHLVLDGCRRACGLLPG